MNSSMSSAASGRAPPSSTSRHALLERRPHGRRASRPAAASTSSWLKNCRPRERPLLDQRVGFLRRGDDDGELVLVDGRAGCRRPRRSAVPPRRGRARSRVDSSVLWRDSRTTRTTLTGGDREHDDRRQRDTSGRRARCRTDGWRDWCAALRGLPARPCRRDADGTRRARRARAAARRAARQRIEQLGPALIRSRIARGRRKSSASTLRPSRSSRLAAQPLGRVRRPRSDAPASTTREKPPPPSRSS